MTVKSFYFYYVYEPGWPKNEGVRRWQAASWEEAKQQAKEQDGEAEREEIDTESGARTLTFCDRHGKESAPVQYAAGKDLTRRQQVMAALKKRKAG